MSGPPPKRSAERRRTNTPVAGPVIQVDIENLEGRDDPDGLPFLIAQPIIIPDVPEQVTGDGDDSPSTVAWHPMAVELWESMKRSGQAIFWEPTDWMMAKLMCESLSRDLKSQFVGVTSGSEGMPSEAIYEKIPLKGASLGAYLKLASSLMLMEGDRRRLSIELERTRLAVDKSTEGDAKVVKITDARQAKLIRAQRASS